MLILMDSHVLQSPESENHIFSSWSLSVCIINVTPKKILPEIPNLAFYVYIVRSLFTGARKKIVPYMLRPMDRMSCWCILIHLDCTK